MSLQTEARAIADKHELRQRCRCRVHQHGSTARGCDQRGIMAERLSPENAGVALLANALATGLGLYVLITILASVSRAHFNPVVTIAAVLKREIPPRMALGYVVAQACGAIAGVWIAHAMFDLPIFQSSMHVRTGIGQWISEAVATAGLLLTIAGTVRYAPAQLAPAVGAYIAAAYWFTASTSFANPAVTMARALSDTFAGIRPVDVPAFIAAQLAGLTVALAKLSFGGGAAGRRSLVACRCMVRYASAWPVLIMAAAKATLGNQGACPHCHESHRLRRVSSEPADRRSPTPPLDQKVGCRDHEHRQEWCGDHTAHHRGGDTPHHLRAGAA